MDHTERPICAELPHHCISAAIFYCPHDQAWEVSYYWMEDTSRPEHATSGVAKLGPFDGPDGAEQAAMFVIGAGLVALGHSRS